jgi:hypothetical protein
MKPAMLDKLVDKISDNAVLFWSIVAVNFLSFLYLRNRSVYFQGASGAAYWDNRAYCDTHRAGQIKIYGALVSCGQIIAYCRKNTAGSLTVDGSTIPCDQFLGKPETPSRLDAF